MLTLQMLPHKRQTLVSKSFPVELVHKVFEHMVCTHTHTHLIILKCDCLQPAACPGSLRDCCLQSTSGSSNTSGWCNWGANPGIPHVSKIYTHKSCVITVFFHHVDLVGSHWNAHAYSSPISSSFVAFV